MPHRNSYSHTKYMISAEASLLAAMERINRLSDDSLTLFVEPSPGSGLIAGSLTDGDIRRALISGASLTDTVDSAMRRDYMALRPDDDALRVFARARSRGVRMLPRLDSDGRLAEVIDLATRKNLLPLDAVLMAGGRGERLRPLTLETPKPLLRIGGKPIIDYNVEELEANGIENIFVTVNYLKEQLIEHFAQRRGSARVSCVEEPCRLGTMGSLALVEGLSHDNLLVMNSDVLTGLSFADMLRHHLDSDADLTMATIGYNVAVPFAILDIDGDRVTGMKEKPSYNYSANAGVYMMKRSLVSRIVPGKYLDAPDFILSLIADGLKVSHFPIRGTWIDIGSPADFKYADELMSRPAPAASY